MTEDKNQDFAETIFYGGDIITVDDDNPSAEAVAVKNGRIISVPDKPFNWIGRPPGINRLIGIYWLAHLMDPGLLEQDIIEEAIDFYAMFYHVELEPTDLETILK